MTTAILPENGVLKTKLENGLTVILKEMHHAPVASFWVWYNVGSRNEKPGITGAAHWVEHMMFKGTPAFPAGVQDRLVSREGGRRNAFTWIDFTAYYETLPSHKIELALQIESDRMVNTVMKPEETESERTVILSERHMYENRPMFLLYEEVQAAAFRVHPYHHETIGDEIDVETMSRDDLYGFYRRYYAPNNATVIAVGDFETGKMLKMVEEYFGGVRPSPDPDPVVRVEPPQKGERQVTVRGPGDTAYLIYAYKSPAASDPDYYPMTLLNAAFSGGGSLGMFGSSTTNKSSRLYKALVSAELAVSVSGGLTPTIDPFLYSVVAVLRPGVEMVDLEAALDAEVGRLSAEKLTQAELDKARKRARVEFIQSSESITGQAQSLGMSQAVLGDHTWHGTVLDRLAEVTLEDIERVREKYLTPDRRTVGRYLPQN